nr:hypothetical protein CFP56_71319 [Quercus suber]
MCSRRWTVHRTTSLILATIGNSSGGFDESRSTLSGLKGKRPALLYPASPPYCGNPNDDTVWWSDGNAHLPYHKPGEQREDISLHQAQTPSSPS